MSFIKKVINSISGQASKVMQLIQHLFNHQTHHRGQVSTLLSQIGIDIGATDFLMVIPNE